MSVRPLTAVALLALAALAGCGKAGGLERPGPLFGPTRSGPVSESDAPQDPTRPMRTIDPRRVGGGDDVTDPAPPRTVPLEGQNPRANDAAPQGVLPDPYARPR